MKSFGRAAREWIAGPAPWTDSVGIARTLLASATALTLALNPAIILFTPLVGLPKSPPINVGPLAWGFFSLFGRAHLELARWIAVAVLLVVASGWRPRWTGFFHWWISWSLFGNATLIDGGDQVSSVLTLLLLPVTLTDPRKWHWEDASSRGSDALRLVAQAALVGIRVQVAAVYFHASIAKFGVEEWADGTAIYYWMTDPEFGMPTWMSRIALPWIAHGPVVTALTWGPLMLEYALSAAIFMPRRSRPLLLALALAFHGAILVVHGLVSFSAAMAAALILYLHPEAFAVRSWTSEARVIAVAPTSGS